MRLSLRAIAVVLLLCSGCGRSAESLIDRQIAILNETATALSTISDQASAEAAAPKLGNLQQEMNSLVPRVKKLDLSAELRQELEDAHRDELNAALDKFQKELARVRALELKVGGLSQLDQAVAD